MDGRATLQLTDAAAASSGSLGEAAADGTLMALHLDGARGPAVRGLFVCVTAAKCVLADAFTKVVMPDPASAAPRLQAFGAEAHVIGPDRVWRSYGGASCAA
jgi:hypothetical protein